MAGRRVAVIVAAGAGLVLPWLAVASGGGANRPMITGPGLAGPGFYSAPGKCG